MGGAVKPRTQVTAPSARRREGRKRVTLQVLIMNLLPCLSVMPNSCEANPSGVNRAGRNHGPRPLWLAHNVAHDCTFFVVSRIGAHPMMGAGCLKTAMRRRAYSPRRSLVLATHPAETGGHKKTASLTGAVTASWAFSGAVVEA